MGNELLTLGEDVVCQHCFPTLFTDRPLGGLKRQVDEIVNALLADVLALRESLDSDPNIHASLVAFFGRLISKGGDSLESYVHAYVFIFWSQGLFDDPLGLEPRGEAIWFAKSEPPGTALSKMDPRYPLARRLKEEGVEVDLVSFDFDRQMLWLIEIKRDELDDRAVGQMLRYFDRASRCLISREFRAGNINFVRPLVVLESVDQRKWASIPLHFRELLDVYGFSVGQFSTKPSFTRIRKQMLSGSTGHF